MKYTSKRVYQNARKSKRIDRDTNQTGGLGGSTVTNMKGRLIKSDDITEFTDLNKINVEDNIIKFKYFVDINGDSIKFTKIEKFYSALTIGWLVSIAKLKPLSYNSFDTMARIFYGVINPFSYITPKGLKRTDISGNSMSGMLDELNSYFESTGRLTKAVRGIISKVSNASKASKGRKGAKDIPETITFTPESVTVGEDEPIYINKDFVDNVEFKKNVVNYFKKLVNPNFNPDDATAATGTAAAATAAATATAATAGVMSSGAVLSDINPTDIPKIQKILGPNAMFTSDNYLILKSKIQTDGKDNYYATETVFDNIICPPAIKPSP
jgi:hypothetical protein